MLPPRSRLPGIVHLIRWMRDPDGSVQRDAARYGDAYMHDTPIFGAQVTFSHPAALKEIFTGDAETFVAGEANRPLGLVLGDRSVLLLDGPEHLRVRRLMIPAFHGERMRHHTDTMREVTRRVLSTLRVGDRVALHSVFQRITVELILLTVLGLEAGPELDRARVLFTRLLDRFQSRSGSLWLLPAMRKDLGPLTPWASIKRDLDETDRLLLAHIAHRRASAEQKNDVFAMLLAAVDEQGNGLDDATLVSQLKTLVIAGHETSASTMAWAFEELLRVPGEQERLIAEAQAVTGGAPLGSDHLPGLERLDSVLKETLRLHPPTGAVGRRLKKPATIGGYDLPADVMVVACMHLTHRRPDLYPDPLRFIPERFIGKKIDPYEWAPFGGGIRRCLGMAYALQKMKVIMATMLSAGITVRLESRGGARTALRSMLYAPEGETRVVVVAKSPPVAVAPPT